MLLRIQAIHRRPCCRHIERQAMTTNQERKNTGKNGEDTACRFLMSKGHTIIERNWRLGHLEVDIISMDRAGIHFVEVKTRRPPMQADPQESVTVQKQKRIAAAAAGYMATAGRQYREMECMFDIVSVVLGGEEIEVEYYPEAYIPIFI